MGQAPVSANLRRILKVIEDGSHDMATGWNLPRECYVDPEFYAFEQEAIFMRQWLCLGRVDEIPKPGDFVRVDMGDEPLMMVRGKDMEIRVLSPICAHRAHLVCEGSGNTGRLFRCPFHAWTYGLDGNLIAAPSMNDTVGLKNLKGEAYLPSHRVEIWNGFVFTNLDPDAKPLAPTLTKLTAELENYHIGDMVSMPVAELRDNPWNWKSQLENGIEPYHSAYLHGMLHDFAHVRLTSFVEISPDEGAIYHPTGFYHADAGFNPTTKALLPIIPTLGEKERNQVIFASIPPNLGFGAVPEGLFYYLVLPAGPEHMNLRIGHLYPEESTKHPRFEQLYKIAQDGLVLFHQQDASSDASLQKGMRSRFRRPGRYSFQEESLLQFNQWLLKRYQDYVDLVEGAPEPSATR
ncbi:aromatic ring-hydroxylating oxygenase subunit alpha [Streptosporangium jomthongense]|uniref:Aromatic ring-hydroxylating dioxygenase subunit alpha n=1 Tax=Streptosporangium jomthongense TaxID=1193683 RepID=A0ABV8F3L7_9ACTN